MAISVPQYINNHINDSVIKLEPQGQNLPEVTGFKCILTCTIQIGWYV